MARLLVREVDQPHLLQGLGFGFRVLGFGVLVLGFWVWGVVCGVWVLGLGLGFEV